MEPVSREVILQATIFALQMLQQGQPEMATTILEEMEKRMLTDMIREHGGVVTH